MRWPTRFMWFISAGGDLVSCLSLPGMETRWAGYSLHRWLFGRLVGWRWSQFCSLLLPPSAGGGGWLLHSIHSPAALHQLCTIQGDGRANSSRWARARWVLVVIRSGLQPSVLACHHRLFLAQIAWLGIRSRGTTSQGSSLSPSFFFPIE